MTQLRDIAGALFKGEEELDLTGGPIGRNLFFLSLPIVVTNLLRTAYNLADTFWVGRLSTEALAAIGFAFPVVFFLISLGMGLAIAGSVLVAQHMGARQEDRASYAASQTVTYTCLFSIVMGVAGYLLVGPVTTLLGAEPNVQPLATSYLQIISLGLVFMFGFAVFMALMRGHGDTITPMVLMLASVVLNIVLDPFLIFGWGPFPRLGIEGAAIATIFSRGLAFLAGLAIMFRGHRGVTVVPAYLVPDLEFLRKALRIGVPASVEGAGRALSVNVLLAIVATFSTTVVAAYSAGVRVFITVYLPAVAVERGVETMTGQNIGAGNTDRARRVNTSAAGWLFAGMSTLGVAAFLAAEPIVGIFTTDPEVVAVGAEFVRIGAPTFGFIGAMRVFVGGFRGVGKTVVAALVTFSMLAFIRLPLAWFTSQQLGPTGIWLGIALSNAAGAAIAWVWFRRSDWSARLVDADESGPPETHERPPPVGDPAEAN